tara:strand:- start:1208 stop:1384 length:177 start_codon:yes stop_codon:yes gene_type:complete
MKIGDFVKILNFDEKNHQWKTGIVVGREQVHPGIPRQYLILVDGKIQQINKHLIMVSK